MHTDHVHSPCQRVQIAGVGLPGQKMTKCFNMNKCKMMVYHHHYSLLENESYLGSKDSPVLERGEMIWFVVLRVHIIDNSIVPYDECDRPNLLW